MQLVLCVSAPVRATADSANIGSLLLPLKQARNLVNASKPDSLRLAAFVPRARPASSSPAALDIERIRGRSNDSLFRALVMFVIP